MKSMLINQGEKVGLSMDDRIEFCIEEQKEFLIGAFSLKWKCIFQMVSIHFDLKPHKSCHFHFGQQ